ncbi:pyrroline-5-carboxylate reductase [Mesorhizobium sp. C280B]|uniref:pyrroline-5-carboxylate reductase n=1 Tax=unclassified Mesorhizobium TaxID=325217 RepID=UPI0003CDDEAD|nr:pyrroline-5-carboxylate reductase [Mesorhizobium sp. LSJC280B00]ESW68362.1 pyrroline-5-carboxylate reductase [Mesorhizobium sp. LSJC280B00]
MTGRKFGFIGTGTITDAIVRGLLREPAALSRVLVSPRNAEVAAKLATDFSSVTVAADNHSIVKGCDTVVLAVRPQIAKDVVRSLPFRNGQTVISVMAATDRATLIDWIGSKVGLTQAIPLPFVAERRGITAVYPRDPETAAIFKVLGGVVQCDSGKEYELLAAASALMATYFGIMHGASEWLAWKGLSRDKARSYLAPLFTELSRVALEAPSGVPFAELSRAFATRGGLNEQVLGDFEKHGGADALKTALDHVLARIEKGFPPEHVKT